MGQFKNDHAYGDKSQVSIPVPSDINL